MPPKKTSGPKPTKVSPAELAAASAASSFRRIIPLAGGTWCYLVGPVDGRYKHLEVSSASLDTALAEQRLLSAAYGKRLRQELSTLTYGDFPAALARYDRAAAEDTASQAD